MNCLVTGGAGFIGSHIAQRLLKEGHSVRILDNLSTGKRENIPDGAGFFDRDVSFFSACRITCMGVEAVFHTAALTSIPKSFDFPFGYNECNVCGTLAMVSAAANEGVKKFIFASSSAVYGDILYGPEYAPTIPSSPYGVTKLAGEAYCRIFSEKMDVTCLRYFNVFGPRQDGFVVSNFIEKILANEPLIIYGDGSQKRDFIYIDDVVEANMSALNNKGFNVYNVARGEAVSIQSLINHLEVICGKEAKVIYKPERQGDVPQTLADTSLAQAYGFKAKVSFEDGLRKTVEYYKNEEKT